jgi:hypothetical protein
MSGSDARIHLGMKKRTKIRSLQITWPSGQGDWFANMTIDRLITLKQRAIIIARQFFKIPSYR